MSLNSGHLSGNGKVPRVKPQKIGTNYGGLRRLFGIVVQPTSSPDCTQEGIALLRKI